MTKKPSDPYIGKTIQIKRFGKTVQVFLHQHGNDAHYKGVWLDETGKPQTGIIPIIEIKEALGED